MTDEVSDLKEWYPMHSHDDGMRHMHHRDYGGRGSHDGLALATWDEVRPRPGGEDGNKKTA